jgi:hypothetical protein
VVLAGSCASLPLDTLRVLTIVLSDPKVWSYVEEIAKRFAASYISVQTGTTFNTMYRELKDKHPGEVWMALALMAIKHAQPGAGKGPEIELEELDSKPPVQ